jgi:hypothetical protein
VLYSLAAAGLLLAAYSLSCYFFKVKKLEIIFAGNSAGQPGVLPRVVGVGGQCFFNASQIWDWRTFW